MMAAVDSDGIEESVEGMLRVGLTAAAQLGQEIARRLEEQQRQAQVLSDRQVRESHAGYEAERAIAHAKLAPVHSHQWWDTAGPDRIAEAHRYATAWKDRDPGAAESAGTIRTEVLTRYGIDTDAPGADPARVREALEQAAAMRSDAGRGRTDQVREAAEAQLLIDQADRVDRDRARAVPAAGDEPDPAGRPAAEPEMHSSGARRAYDSAEYDSAGRRGAFAASLEGRADRAVIEARLQADTDQGRHPREAVSATRSKAPKARRTRGVTGQEAQRSGLSH